MDRDEAETKCYRKAREQRFRAAEVSVSRSGTEVVHLSEYTTARNLSEAQNGSVDLALRT